MTLPGREFAPDDIPWAMLVRPGDLVVWGQASAEPITLTASLMAARGDIGDFGVFAGICVTPSIDPVFTDRVSFSSYCGTANNRLLGSALDILPISYADLADALARHRPVLLLSLARGQDRDHLSFGAGADYLADLIGRARLVIAEVSDGSPRSGNGRDIRRDQIDIIVRSRTIPPAPKPARLTPVEQLIAEKVAGMIEDGATLQIGLGNVPTAVLRALSAHRDLGVHSGVIVDEIAELASSRIVTNARKSIDRGLTVTGLLSGGPTLMQWADGNSALALRPTSYTHDYRILSSLERFTAINSAVEVDLTGQVNAEVADGRYVGSVGGAGAFLRGAHQARGGLPIIALPSRAGTRSRIVSRLSGPVSTARADVGLVVTEHGVADLRGLGVRARRERMLGIADPTHQPQLERDLSFTA
ncbi:MAG: acetyl-CoA hydrolase/transferase [Bradyrhizobium sp.]|nr:acetyl-CoA hydrolase/transferase [Bradyrhizobium sp.]